MSLDAKTYYLIRTVTGTSVLCRRGREAPKAVSGGARYNVVERPRRKSTVQWAGDDPDRMDVPILLDGWIDGLSIETSYAKINQLKHSKGDLVPPTEFYIDGALPISGARWVMEDITWGDEVIWSANRQSTNGYRLRQDGVLHLLQSVPLAVLQLNRPPSAATPYIITSGDTLASIAAKRGVTVTELKKANNIRDPKQVAQMVGQALLIPPAVKGLK